MFHSTFRKVWSPEPIAFPTFSNTRVMMMPVILGQLYGIPDKYCDLVAKMYEAIENRFRGMIGYITIDERLVLAGNSLRRGGLHVDGYYHGRSGAWGGGGGWGSVGNGMLTLSSTPHCRAYPGLIEGEPKDEGECDHLTMPNDGVLFDANQIYWVDGACVHESVPVESDTRRQFVRLSMPNNGPWFEGYTENPYGIKPSAEILPRRQYMDS